MHLMSNKQISTPFPERDGEGPGAFAGLLFVRLHNIILFPEQAQEAVRQVEMAHGILVRLLFLGLSLTGPLIVSRLQQLHLS